MRIREAESLAMEAKTENEKRLIELKDYQKQLEKSKEQLKKVRLNANVMIRNVLQDVS